MKALVHVTLKPASDEAAARTQLDELCAKLLANPVIEDYEVVRFDR